MSADQQKKQACLSLSFCGELCEVHSDGSLYLPSYRTLVVSDLHFEKGHAQSSGAPLPRYDTDATFAKLEKAFSRTNPQTCIFLGDSFHNADVARTLPPVYREAIDKLAKNRDFIWIEGNHDPAPLHLSGTHLATLPIPPPTFRHIPLDRDSGEVGGHFHPKIHINLKGRYFAKPCFLLDTNRVVLPAYGTFTGGLKTQSPVLMDLMRPEAVAIVTGKTPRVIAMPRAMQT